MSYTVIELQDGVVGDAFRYASPDYQDPKAEAEAKYHQILSVAAKSSVRNHGCIIIEGSGIIDDSKFYPHAPAGGEQQ